MINWKRAKQVFLSKLGVFAMGVVTGVIVSIITSVGSFLVHSIFLDNPNFSVRAEYNEDGGPNVIEFYVHNQNNWINYDARTVYLNLIIPVSLLGEDKKLERFGMAGAIKFILEKNQQKFPFNNDIYHVLSLPAIDSHFNKKSSKKVLRVSGDFNSGEIVKIYFVVSTPDGFFPDELNDVEFDDNNEVIPMTADALSNLPHFELTLP